MGWLVACPHHYLGLLGLIYFNLALYYQPNIKGSSLSCPGFLYSSKDGIVAYLLVGFFISILYAVSYLPYGKFYVRLGGNPASFVSFSFIIIFLSINTDFFKKKILSLFPKITKQFNISL